MTEVYSVRLSDQRAITSADQAEIAAIRNGQAVLDAGVSDEGISGELDDLEVGNLPGQMQWNLQDLRSDELVGQVRDEIKRRIDLIGEAYPFLLQGGQIKYVPSVIGFYEYCLGISCTKNSISSLPYAELPRSFERDVALIVKKHLGPDWKNLHTGTPRDDGQPTRLDAMLPNVGLVSSNGREWRWDPEPEHPRVNSSNGDSGLDYVLWRPSADSRIGQLYVVGQCACGNDWDTKFFDLTEQKLKRWLRPLSYVSLVRSFATPFILSDGNFMLAHKDAGWVFDRLRLSKIVFDQANDLELAALAAKFSRLLSLSLAE